MNKKIRIGLIMQGGPGWMGGIEYIKNLIFALASLPSEVRKNLEICLICSKSLDVKLYESIHLHLDKVFYTENILNPLNLQNSVAWKLFRSIFLWSEKFDFVYPNSVSIYPDPLRHVARTCVRAGWIPDFQSRYLPEFYTSKQLSAVNRSCNTIVRQTSVVILSSRTAELDFQKFYPLHVDKIKVLPFRTYSLDAWYEPDPEQIQYKYSLPDRFLIVSNQFWQHKNHLLVFRALKILQDQSVYPIVVCTGNLYDHRQPNYSNVILQAIDELNLNNQVHLLGLIHRLDQIQLMRRALAVIQPSLFEGWSTVVEDSRCLGKEILLSDIAVHLEQNPPNGQFFEQNSPEDLACLMKQCWETLTPGPNLAHEEVAKELNKTEVQDFGYRFLEIVKDSLLV